MHGLIPCAHDCLSFPHHGAQHGEDVAQAEVVVRLLGQLLLAQPVQHEELLRQVLVVLVPVRQSLNNIYFLKLNFSSNRKPSLSYEVG